MAFIPAATASEPGRGHEQDGGGVRTGEDREKREVIRVPAAVPFSAERRPKRKKTSEVVTMMEMVMRTIMIHV